MRIPVLLAVSAGCGEPPVTTSNDGTPTTGGTAEPGPYEVLFSVDAGAPIPVGAVAWDNALAVVTARGTVASYDIADGTERWTAELGGAPNCEPVVLADGSLIAASDANYATYSMLSGAVLSAYNPVDTLGSPLIVMEAPGGAVALSGENGLVCSAVSAYGRVTHCDITVYNASGGIRVRNGIAYVPSGGSLAEVPLSGAPGWRYHPDGYTWLSSTPAVGGSKVFGVFDDDTLYAVDQESGALEWEYVLRESILGSPEYGGGLVFLAGRQGTLSAIDEATGERSWKFSAAAGFSGTPAFAEGVLYVGSDDGTVYALSVDGAELWTYATADAVTGRILVAGDIIYVTSIDGTVTALQVAPP